MTPRGGIQSPARQSFVVTPGGTTMSDAPARLVLDRPADARVAAALLAGGTPVAHGFAGIYALTSRGDDVRQVNALKGRPLDQTGSVTAPAGHVLDAFDLSALPPGVSAVAGAGRRRRVHRAGPVRVPRPGRRSCAGGPDGDGRGHDDDAGHRAGRRVPVADVPRRRVRGRRRRAAGDLVGEPVPARHGRPRRPRALAGRGAARRAGRRGPGDPGARRRRGRPQPVPAAHHRVDDDPRAAPRRAVRTGACTWCWSGTGPCTSAAWSRCSASWASA